MPSTGSGGFFLLQVLGKQNTGYAQLFDFETNATPYEGPRRFFSISHWQSGRPKDAEVEPPLKDWQTFLPQNVGLIQGGLHPCCTSESPLQL